MAEMKDAVWQIEQGRVDQVTEVIDRKMEAIEEKSGNIKENIVNLRKTFWDDVTVNLDEPDDVIETHTSLRQQAELLSERERSHGLLSKQWNNLHRLKSSPYFGRIDFKEEGEETESIYIGLFSLTDESGEKFLVYDWRAPISSMYYDFAPGKAQYETMDGPVRGEMELKRQFIIKNSEIKGMFDTGITIGDEILQEVLSSQADAQMKNIVATIQKEQNQIIRNDKKKYLVVQGAAGSGKTSAALQRVAYLLYRYRDQLRPDNILLFSPNPLFNSYVSSVLPELGEENMQQSTFYQYLQHRLADIFQIEDAYSQLEYMLSAPRNDNYFSRKEGINFKSSLVYKQLLDKYIQHLGTAGMTFRNIKFHGEQFIRGVEIEEYFYKLDSSISIPNRIQLVKEWLIGRLDEKEQEERTKEWVEQERELLDREDYLKIFKKLQKQQRFTDDTFDDFDREEKLLAEWIVRRRINPLKRKVEELSFINLNAIYNQLFEWSVNNTESIMEVPERWQEIGEQTINNIQERRLPFEDATPFLYLKDKIEGRQSFTKIRHLFIDEAQDYSPFQFAFLQEIFPNSKMTVLGDINQSILTHSVNEQNGLEKSGQLFPDEQLEKIVLTKSYRSTRQITEFAEEMLEERQEIEAFNRNGEKPVVYLLDEQKYLNEGIINRVGYLKEKGYESIAIICKTAKETIGAYNELKESLELQFIRKETQSYEKGVSIIPSYLAKGIEFDAVIIYNASSEIYAEEGERKLFYTACTRAMHELNVFVIGEKSPFIQKVSIEKYNETTI